jgi:hypothetical protein
MAFNWIGPVLGYHVYPYFVVKKMFVWIVVWWWSNPKLTLNDYKAILSCHVAQFSYFNRMVEKKEIFVCQNISKDSNDPTCHIFRQSHVNILVCIVIASLVVGIHPWIHIKILHTYILQKNNLIYHLWLMLLIVCCLLLGWFVVTSVVCD